MTLLPVLHVDAETCVRDRDSGELFQITVAPTAILAAAVDELVALQQEARSARGALEHELRQRIGSDTRMLAGVFGVEASRKREWDRELTWQALSDLVDAGLITAKAADEAMPERTERRADGRKCTALLTSLVGRDPVAAQALANARDEKVLIKVSRTSTDATAVDA